MSTDLVLRKAKKLTKAGQKKQALELCRLHLEKFPGSSKTRSEVARLQRSLQEEKEPPKADQKLFANRYLSGEQTPLLAKVMAELKSFPHSSFLWCLAGNLHAKLSQPKEALEAFNTAIKCNPRSVDPFLGISQFYKSQGELQKAMLAAKAATEVNDKSLSALNELAVVLGELDQLEDAIAVLEKAIAISPKFAPGHYNLGLFAERLRRVENAEKHFENAARFAPDRAEVFMNLGLCQRLLGKLPPAAQSFRKALQIDPLRANAIAELLHANAHMCAWREDRPDLATSNGPVAAPFPFLAFEDDPIAQRNRSVAYAAQYCFTDARVLPKATTSEGKITVGYFSADFHEHATMHLLGGLFENHDRTRFRIIAFSFGPPSDDSARQRVTNSVDEFYDIERMPDSDVLDLVDRVGLDIAIDLKGYTGDHRAALFGGRLAPIQVAWLGYPGTMGHPQFDYVIADKVVLPPEQTNSFTEKAVLMPGSYQINDDSREISGREFAKQECGLPETGFVFCCFNASYKITPAEFEIWMRLLKKFDDAVLWLLASNTRAKSNLLREAKLHGIAENRLIFAERLSPADHLARHKLADLFLDTFVCNAHTTASDALWAGLPVITKAGQQFASRVAASLLHAVDLPELVVETAEKYENLATTLARNPERLADIKAKLDVNKTSSSLFDTQRFVASLETAFETMVRKQQNGEPPECFSV